jgi:hypothetical protein
MSGLDDDALEVHAGPRALAWLRREGLRAQDVRVVPAAAGGPKGLVLNGLDRYIFGRLLPQSSRTVHLIGASIGAWRMATACISASGGAEAERQLAEFAREYVEQRYDRRPTPAEVSRQFGAQIERFFAGRVDAVLSHPRYRLHIVTSRGRHLLAREAHGRAALGYLGALAANLLHRKAMQAWLERVVFSSAGEPLPLPLSDYRSRQVPLTAANFGAALRASCSIPFVLQAVHDIPGAPRGAYWDGGITDYHLHWRYDQLAPPAESPVGHAAHAAPSERADCGEMASEKAGGLVLYPHFQPQLVPGWLDKPLKRRHRASAALDNVVVLCPSRAFVARLPNGKLPDRKDFTRYGADFEGRVRAWRRALDESERLAEAFARRVEQQRWHDVQPLLPAAAAV